MITNTRLTSSATRRVPILGAGARPHATARALAAPNWVSSLLPFFVLVTAVLVAVAPAFSAGESGKVTDKESDPKVVIYGPHEVIEDRFLRHPGHYKESKEWEWKGLTKSDRKDLDTTLRMKVGGDELKTPAGPHFHQKADKQKSGDQYVNSRPNYRPMELPCGLPGFFYPPTPTFIKNFNKSAKAEGGTVPVGKPTILPKCLVIPTELKAQNNGNLSKEGDQALWEYELTTFGLGPISDTQFQMIDREDNQRFLELLYDPERWHWMAKAANAMQHEQMATNMAQTADSAYNTAVDTIEEYLINVANESAAEPVSGNPTPKTKQQAIYMVQQMFKQVYIPMAVLLLLPGAVMTQVKSMVQFGVLDSKDSESSDTQTPFQGLIRSVIAIFLIPATQLIVSYMIDVGNSLAFEVKHYVENDILFKYAHEQMYDPKIEKTVNWLPITDPPGSSKIQGKGYNSPENETRDEQMPALSKQVQAMYNFANYAMTTGLTVLAAFQLVIMCYLFLLGPVAAALYAWPTISKGGGGGPSLFNKVFQNWLDGVVLCSLWRFWWMVVLATMCTYIKWSTEMGFFDPTDQWEMMIFTSFQVMLIFIPSAPFDFNAKGMVAEIEKRAKDSGGGGGGGGAGGSQGGGPTKGGGGTAPTQGTNAGDSGGTTTTSSPAIAPAPAPSPTSSGDKHDSAGDTKAPPTAAAAPAPSPTPTGKGSATPTTNSTPSAPPPKIDPGPPPPDKK